MVETHLTADSHAALAALPLSYPWSCLVLDLKELLPILDRYVLSCIIASHATLYTDLTHDQALFPLLRALAQTIVNIISPQASLNTRPVLPKEIYKVDRSLGSSLWLKPRLLKHGCARFKAGRHTRCSVWFGLATIVVTRCSVITLELKTG